VCKETHTVSENKTLSLFLHTHISKKRVSNGADPDFAANITYYRKCGPALHPRPYQKRCYQKQCVSCFGSNMVFVYISKHANTQS